MNANKTPNTKENTFFCVVKYAVGFLVSAELKPKTSNNFPVDVEICIVFSSVFLVCGSFLTRVRAR